MKVGHLIVPVDDIGTAVEFYSETMGLSERFRDGDRYAALTDGSVTLGLATAVEQPVPGRIVLSFQVGDLAAFLAAWPGGEDVAVTEGGHERRATLSDPFGNPVVVYERS
ncbi:VOC family protein [Nocardioides sp. Bht2]|uniref:VOC family protein n=1 Tax=Nocardioides sp. Bht2 TaxID=3392297 RepID=UPI0039B3866A